MSLIREEVSEASYLAAARTGKTNDRASCCLSSNPRIFQDHGDLGGEDQCHRMARPAVGYPADYSSLVQLILLAQWCFEDHAGPLGKSF